MKITKEKIKAFLDQFVVLCREHKLSLGHEDTQGVFIVEEYDPYYSEWVQDATIGESLTIEGDAYLDYSSEQAAASLDDVLRKMYNNIQSVAIVPNVEGGDPKHSLVVYTTTKPTKEQLKTTEHALYRVEWQKMGKVRPAKEV